ncbi:hypothetical protein B0H13DRAFT_2681887, partial [Mycena leptocephala]
MVFTSFWRTKLLPLVHWLTGTKAFEGYPLGTTHLLLRTTFHTNAARPHLSSPLSALTPAPLRCTCLLSRLLRRLHSARPPPAQLCTIFCTATRATACMRSARPLRSPAVPHRPRPNGPALFGRAHGRCGD